MDLSLNHGPPGRTAEWGPERPSTLFLCNATLPRGLCSSSPKLPTGTNTIGDKNTHAVKTPLVQQTTLPGIGNCRQPKESHGSPNTMRVGRRRPLLRGQAPSSRKRVACVLLADPTGIGRWARFRDEKADGEAARWAAVPYAAGMPQARGIPEAQESQNWDPNPSFPTAALRRRLGPAATPSLACDLTPEMFSSALDHSIGLRMRLDAFGGLALPRQP